MSVYFFVPKLCLCQGGESLAEGRLSLKLLSSQDTLDAKVELKSQELAGILHSYIAPTLY